MLSIDPDDDIVAMLSIEPDTIVSAEAASTQPGQRPPGASAASGLPQRGHVALIEESDETAGKGYVLSVRSRYLSSSSISPASDTVSAIAARSSARNTLRSRCTATFTAPSVLPSCRAAAA